MLGLLKSGDHVLVTDNAYSPTRHFCDNELKKFGIETTYYDPTIGAGIAGLIKPNTKLIYIESPGSLTLEVADVPAITKVARANKVLTVIDNTYATAWFFDAFAHGVDITITSATKYIGGHSDILIGTICCSDKIYPHIKRMHKSLGICAGADDVYLALRGLRTLGVRLEHQQKAAINIAKALEKSKKVAAVLHPALPSHPQNKIFKRDFSGSSGLFSFVLNKKLTDAGYSKFLDNMKLFKMGYSWGGFESLIIPFHLNKIRTASNFAHSGSAFRLSIGLEDEADLLADLESALARIS
jgi:cystathionine beta-lyase